MTFTRYQWTHSDGTTLTVIDDDQKIDLILLFDKHEYRLMANLDSPWRKG